MKEILYVEDSVDTAEAVQIILESKGYHVDLANTGKEGIILSNKKQYDLFLLDVMLPDMSGWDIYEKIKTKKKSKFAFLSAIPVSKERIDHLKKEGVSDYIMKPFVKDDLIKRVNKMLG